ncbi:MAG: tRNA uridine-5-carboxymethylaminomethyl(34) synthesis GTPase MnmE [Gammaproteobacteria bacterium]|nr:tRNA uridine-5-carboxymethylaminomethyl(34) synthesis GTPase MnmE [Gammaproteobacteria bacterium]
MPHLQTQDTITAIATAAGRGGIGIVRVSGPLTKHIAQKILKTVPTPRQVHTTKFYAADGSIIDDGIALYFVAPHSFTGEDVLELQGHGGAIVLDQVLKRTIEGGARLARPGEFSERAFLNDKIDLTQAEAIADLIDASSEQAARAAMRSLQGEFSKKINHLVEQLIHLRTYVEASIDFPEEEIDFLSDGKVQQQVEQIKTQLTDVLAAAQQGVLLKDGITVVIAGKPNAGKSSLLNCLSERDSAIVTEVAGTTRDVLREHIQIDGLPLHILDTAGLRHSEDLVEQEGIRRAWLEISKADLILLVIDSTDNEINNADYFEKNYSDIFALNKPIIIVFNKIDLSGTCNVPLHASLSLSAKTGAGLPELKQAIKKLVGFQPHNENNFLARRRHLDALERAQNYLQQGSIQLTEQRAGELLAEDLRQAQNCLNEITGEFTSDDLLGRIFSSFCIGK